MLREIKALSGQDIFDIAIATGYTIDHVYTLLAGNPSIVNINADIQQRVFEYDDAFKIPPPPQLAPGTTTTNTSRSFTIIENQNIFDVALQTIGGLDGIVKFLSANNFDNLNLWPLKGKTVNFSVSDIEDVGFFNYLTKSKITISTAYNEIQQPVTNYRLLESGEIRILESGERRILE